MTSEKGGRNADGTFAPGNRPVVTENYGRKPRPFSSRELAKIYGAKEDPKTKKSRLQAVIDKLYEMAASGDVQAIDKVIKLTGNYDPTEQKIDLNDNRNPFAGVDPKKLEKALGTNTKRTTSSQSGTSK